jgi:hypothetical protein
MPFDAPKSASWAPAAVALTVCIISTVSSAHAQPQAALPSAATGAPAPTPTPPSKDPCVAPSDGPPPCADARSGLPYNWPLLGDSQYHPFDKHYVLGGINWQNPCNARVFEFEVSHVPSFLIARNLWWLGWYGHVGYQDQRTSKPRCTLEEWHRHQPPEGERSLAMRYGGGVEAGWRMITVDSGVVHNAALEQSWGWRVRVGLSLAQEVFTGANARYRTSCCRSPSSKDEVCPSCIDSVCECDRTAVGIALFLYYAHELYPAGEVDPVWADGMVGLSFKLGFGL